MKRTYKSGDWLVKCDRCGLTKYATQCRMTWDNLFVCEDTCWEPRHPQEFVRGRLDQQSVPIARPDVQSMSLSITLGSGASANAASVVVSSITGIYEGTGLGIELDSGTVQWVYATATPTTTTVSINPRLWEDAASGNTVYVMWGSDFMTATQATATML